MTKTDKVRKFDIPGLDEWQYTRKRVTGYQVKEFAKMASDFSKPLEDVVIAAIETFVDKVYDRDGGEVDPLQQDWMEVVVPLGRAARNWMQPHRSGESSDES